MGNQTCDFKSVLFKDRESIANRNVKIGHIRYLVEEGCCKSTKISELGFSATLFHTVVHPLSCTLQPPLLHSLLFPSCASVYHPPSFCPCGMQILLYLCLLLLAALLPFVVAARCGMHTVLHVLLFTSLPLQPPPCMAVTKGM